MADADTAGRSLCKAFTEPRMPGMVALRLADGAPSAPCQEGGSGSFPLLDSKEPQERVLGTQLQQQKKGFVGQEVGPLYVTPLFRVQGCKLAGCLLLLLVSQGPAALPSLCCLVAVAHKVLQCQGAIRDDFTPLKGLSKAIHLLLSKQQVKVVLKKVEAELASGHTGQ